ncbi:LacI family DNA-binding transcriptional regulator [Fictibacillus phosphorivorans]|uniref:LacI family DNA-binding transcriptional regulator n=1 Tax=Fictibacillus phosphorivorans TaxID=1221500 RepID=UPI0020426CFC|nr:LacI family DNA-binding transcriptional regulator [Fictibacillus phosphorivorans]MCM3717626.1 LacI family transcriptional regulator [Fictibacillus phosphorivorans]MCM3775526.1 LacI family transcriptional regulator [Fictibacillus phosphorivorans]
MVTIKDIARLSGVSKSTVARILSNSGSYSDVSKEKVLKIAQELNYKPNSLARAMITKKTNNIGLVIHSRIYPVISHPFFASIVSSAVDAATKQGYSVMVFNDKEIQNSLDNIRQKQMDGIILAGYVDKSIVQELKSNYIPVVLVNDLIDTTYETSYVINDDFGGSFQAIQYLIDSGHKTIGFIHGPKDSQSYHQRLSGYKEAFKQGKIEWDERYVVYQETPNIEGGIQATKQLLAADPLPTAIFAGNDMMAIGVIKEIKSRGLQVPYDIAVVGFDDIEFSSIYEPALTTVRTDKKLMGEMAVQELIRQLEGADEANTITLPTELIIREST